MSAIPRLIGPPPDPSAPEGERERELSPAERAELFMHTTAFLSHVRTELFGLCESEELEGVRDPPAVVNFDDFARRTMNALCDGMGASKAERKRALDAIIRFVPFDVGEASSLRHMDSGGKKYLLSTILLVLLLTKRYDARARCMLCRIALAIGYDQGIADVEATVALNLASENRLTDQGATENYVQKSQQRNRLGRILGVGAATIGGGLLIGLTGGLAAPFIGAGLAAGLASVGLGGSALASGMAMVAGNAALIGSIFGGYGASVSGEAVSNRMKDVEDFEIVDLSQSVQDDGDEDSLTVRRLHVTICVSGWLTEPDDAVAPWKVLGDSEGDRFALKWEQQALTDVGAGLMNIVRSLGGRLVVSQLLQQTALATLTMAVWPLALLNAGYLIDNPWLNARSLAEKTGKVLADVLLARTQGERPVSLIGASLGATVIFECLLELEKRKGFGIVEDVVLLGAPVPSDHNSWLRVRRVTAGRVVNAYSTNDWVLAFCYRTLNFKLGVAGLAAIETVPGIENVDLSETVSAHTAYRYPALLLKQCGFEHLVDAEVLHQQTEATEEAEAESANRIAEIDLERPPAGDRIYEEMQRPKPGESLPPWLDEQYGKTDGFTFDDGIWVPNSSRSPITPTTGKSEVLFEATEDEFGPTSPIKDRADGD